MYLKVYSSHDDLTFHQEDISFALERLSPSYPYNVYYVYDKRYRTYCFVNLGGHLSAIVFLLKKYYGLFKEGSSNLEDTGKWQKIIKENFIIYNSMVDSPQAIAEELGYGDVVWWAKDVVEKV